MGTSIWNSSNQSYSTPETLWCSCHFNTMKVLCRFLGFVYILPGVYAEGTHRKGAEYGSENGKRRNKIEKLNQNDHKQLTNGSN